MLFIKMKGKLRIMKSFILKRSQNHTELRAYVDVNNLGYQLIVFRHENLNGVVTESCKSFKKGNHISTKDQFLSAYTSSVLLANLIKINEKKTI